MPTRIIIADDEAIQRMDLKDILSKQGYLVVGEAGDGVSAVNLAREIRPDLVIMDIRMPDMDGIAAAETLTQEKIAPVLLLTAFGDQPLVERAKDAGVVNYIVKPLRESEVAPAIEVALAQREIPHRWLKARIKRIPESLTFEADLEFAPLYVLEVHHQRWCGRTRRKLPDNPETWPTQHVTPLVITTRSDWQREITMMMSSLEASRESEILNVSFRRSSPHFIVTIALSAIAPNAGGTELFTVLQELAGSASASRF